MVLNVDSILKLARASVEIAMLTRGFVMASLLASLDRQATACEAPKDLVVSSVIPHQHSKRECVEELMDNSVTKVTKAASMLEKDVIALSMKTLDYKVVVAEI